MPLCQKGPRKGTSSCGLQRTLRNHLEAVYRKIRVQSHFEAQSLGADSSSIFGNIAAEQSSGAREQLKADEEAQV
ncbi:hypothetical protein IFM89_028906 [Coptis chinensis]|uniref:Uncharacterized protein n=1 Tax=Coptis chinensis TaxID=261450 RepID=A0A835LJU4_9MAGN|nr:hypothetical protein IFM89_028906 [Coptis chinensis]